MTHLSPPLIVGGMNISALVSDAQLPNVRGRAGGRVFYVGATSLALVNEMRLAGQPVYPTLFGTTGALAGLGGRTTSGDVIYVLPGHTESVSAADMASDTGAASGFSIVGLGSGTMRPAFTWTAATATWLLDTENVEIANCRLFLAGATTSTTALTVAAPITASAAGCRLVNNYVNVGVDADQIVTVGITTTAAADDFVFDNNFVEGDPTAEITAAGTVLRLVGADRAKVTRNYMAAALATDTDGLIEFLTTASLNVLVHSNFVYANGSGNTCAIDAGAALANTGFLDFNQLVVDADGTAQTVAFTVSGTCNFALGQNNFMVSNNNERGLIVGTATT